MREPRQQAKLGFLCSFIEERVDYPPDGSNGTCVIHYRCRSIMYDMHVNLTTAMIARCCWTLLITS